MTTETLTLAEFLLARIAEDEQAARDVLNWPKHVGILPAPYLRVLAECEAKRRIIELHQDWPVLVEAAAQIEPSFGADLSSVDQVTYRMSRQIAWMTEQEYRNRFGSEPPTGAIIRALASVYADHAEYRAEWAL